MEIFDSITKEHIFKAKELIDKEGVENKYKGRDYAVEIDEKEYPFKYLVAKAYDFATGQTLDVNDFPSSSTLRNKFEKLYDFKIININNMNLSEYINRYKVLINSVDYKELYKWEVVKNFQDKWDADATDFAKMLSDSLQPEGCNLWVGNQYYPRKVLTGIANKYPEEVREMFSSLFNEASDLRDRISSFVHRAEELLKLVDPDKNLSTYQDKRAILVYLTLMYPDKYYLYKNKMYNDFCEITGVKEKPGRSKKGNVKMLTDYFELCNEVKQELINDKDLIDKHIKRLDYTKDYKEKEYNLLTQDFIYCISRDSKKEPSIVSEENNNNKNEQSNMKTNSNLNIILYGPPGTGKTYNTIDKAVEIITGNKSGNHEKNKLVFDKLRKNGQIEFVTFHQNYAYEDFVVGIKPDTCNKQLLFRENKGIFYEITKRAEENFLNPKISIIPPKSVDEIIKDILAPIDEGKEVEIKMKSGISYYISEYSKSSIPFRTDSGGTALSLSIYTIKDILEGNRETPSGLTSYYDPFVDLIREKIKSEENGNMANINEDAFPEKFVLIIDEINRANISRVFGELITLIEEDKRLDGDNELKITLPNKEKDFGIPPNLYIVGTMNTADKSIALVDIALRRRFHFEGFYPSKEILSKLLSDKKLSGLSVDLLNSINKKISEKKGIDFVIGHAYFINKINDDEIVVIIRNKIIPLLNEYFSSKNDIIVEIFKDSPYSVVFNTDLYDWDIIKKD